MKNTNTIKYRIQPLSIEDSVRHIKLITDDLDDVVSHVNDLRVKLITETTNGFGQKLEELFEAAWDPLLSQIYSFQEVFKRYTTEMEDNIMMEQAKKALAEIPMDLSDENSINEEFEEKNNSYPDFPTSYEENPNLPPPPIPSKPEPLSPSVLDETSLPSNSTEDNINDNTSTSAYFFKQNSPKENNNKISTPPTTFRISQKVDDIKPEASNIPHQDSLRDITKQPVTARVIEKVFEKKAIKYTTSSHITSTPLNKNTDEKTRFIRTASESYKNQINRNSSAQIEKETTLKSIPQLPASIINSKNTNEILKEEENIHPQPDQSIESNKTAGLRRKDSFVSVSDNLRDLRLSPCGIKSVKQSTDFPIKSSIIKTSQTENDQVEILDFLKSMDHNISAGTNLEGEENISFKSIHTAEESANILSHIFSSFYNSEKIYHDTLYCLKMFNAAISNFAQDDSNTSIIIENNKLFGKILRISKFHENWLEILESKKGSADEFQCLTQFFSTLREQLPVYKENTLARQSYIEILSKFRQQKGVLDIIPKSIDANGIKMSFEEAMDRPTTRMSEYYCTINDVIKNTDSSNPLYSVLTDARDEISIYFEVIKYNPKDKRDTFRQIIKWGLIIELKKDGVRKPRVLLIYSDYLVCAAEKTKGNYVAIWYYPLKKVFFTPDNSTDSRYKDIPYVPIPKVHIDELKEEIFKLREECEINMAKKNSKKLEKSQKALSEKEAELALKFPSTPLRLYFPGSQSIFFLCISENILNTWKHIIEIRHNTPLIEEWSIYQSEIQSVIDSVAKHLSQPAKSDISKFNASPTSGIISVNPVAAPTLTGKLFVKIIIRRSAAAANESLCHVEMDKHVKGSTKHKNKNSKMGISQNDAFTFDLDNSAGYLYITFIRHRNRAEENLGGFVSNLIAEEITKKPYLRKVKEFKGGRMLLFIEFSTSAQEPQFVGHFNPRNPSIVDIVKSELSEIPSIISLSIESIEHRGLTEIGIYRLSGVTSQAVQLGKDWNEGWIMTEQDLEPYDVHVVASNLKSFLRELQEPLLSSAVIKQICTFDFQNGTTQQFLAILNNLPHPNTKSFVIIMNHLVAVERCHEENKMTAQNLATVFGVNLLGLGTPLKPDQQQNEPLMFAPINVFVSIIDFWIANFPIPFN